MAAVPRRHLPWTLHRVSRLLVSHYLIHDICSRPRPMAWPLLGAFLDSFMENSVFLMIIMGLERSKLECVVDKLDHRR